MARRLVRLLAAGAIASLVLPSIGSSSAAEPVAVPGEVVAAISAGKTSAYVVVMHDEPLVATEGPDHLDSDKAARRARRLRDGHDRALRDVGLSTSVKEYDYTVSVSGFSAELSVEQAAALAAQPGVRAVFPDELRRLQTESSPDFLGLTAPAGPWAKGLVGEDVVIGVVDTGVWPEHPSFADDGSYGPAPPGFVGTGCQFGSAVPGAQAFNPADADFACNGKLLAAKAYGIGFHGGVGTGLDPGSFLSARDEDGHGSHTASTAAGNADVAATLLGRPFGDVSGIAPRARISVYKACWSATPTSGGCLTSDLVAAIDQAVADGVDVINYSIGSSSFALGADDISFLFAAAAGVHVATSAGNSGPGDSTIGSPASVPWLTSVGASTQNREYVGSLTLDGGAAYPGITITGGTAPGLEVVDADDLANALCNPAVPFDGSVAGKIVVCRRGAIARVAKSLAVSNAGGAGMVLYNATPNDSLNTDNHYVPSVHVDSATGLAILAALPGTGRIVGGVRTATPGSAMGAFSSRGPNGLSPDIIKPDVTAPGVNILAANTPTALLGAPGQLFQSISGTSMSSPHVAGIFALLAQAHPDWSPAIARSALMTTARLDVVEEDGVTPADPFDVGAGHVRPGGKAGKGSLYEPGLAYDAGLREYAGFTCGAGLGLFTPASCAFLASIGVPFDPSDLNLASIGVAELVGSQTVTRRVTSVATESGWRTYDVEVHPPPGFAVTVSPPSFRIRRGQSVAYTVTFTDNGSAPLGEWSFGSLTWRDRTGHYDVHSPVALRAVEFSAPTEVSGAGTSGSAGFEVGFGYDGAYDAAPHGLVAPATQASTVHDDPADDINVALGTCDFAAPFPWPCTGVTWHAVSVPAATVHTRVSLFDAFTDGSDDLDLYVFDSGLRFVGGSGSGTSAEQVDIAFPTDTSYLVAVHGWQTDGPTAGYTLFDWDVPAAGGGNLTVESAPAAAVLGTTGTVEVRWAGLAAATRYLGAVSHTGPGPTVLGVTLIAVDSS